MMRMFVSSTSLQRRALQFERESNYIEGIQDIYLCSDKDSIWLDILHKQYNMVTAYYVYQNITNKSFLPSMTMTL